MGEYLCRKYQRLITSKGAKTKSLQEIRITNKWIAFQKISNKHLVFSIYKHENISQKWNRHKSNKLCMVSMNGISIKQYEKFKDHTKSKRIDAIFLKWELFSSSSMDSSKSYKAIL